MNTTVVICAILAAVVLFVLGWFLWRLDALLYWMRLELETRRDMEYQIKEWHLWQTEPLKRKEREQ